MRKALDTSVVTCPGEGGWREGKRRLASESALPPLHQPHQGPRAARKVASYRNHPPVLEPQHRVAQE